MTIKTIRSSIMGLQYSSILLGGTTVAALLIFIRLIFPFVIEKESLISSYIQESLGHHTSFKNLEGGWAGWNPTIRIGNFKIYKRSTNATIFTADKVEVAISLFQTIMSARLSLQKIVVNGANFSITRKKNGRILINGMSSSKNNFFDWLFSQRKFHLTASGLEITDLVLSKTEEISDFKITSLNRRQTTNIQGEGHLSSIGEKIHFHLKPQKKSNFIDFEGEIGLSVDKLDPSLFLETFPILNRDLIQSQLDLVCWFQLQEGKIKGISYNLTIKEGNNHKIVNDPAVYSLASSKLKISGQLWSQFDRWLFEMGTISINKQRKKTGLLSGFTTLRGHNFSSVYIRGTDVPAEFASILNPQHLMGLEKNYEFKWLGGEITALAIAWDEKILGDHQMRLLMGVSDFEIAPSWRPSLLAGSGFFLEANLGTGKLIFKQHDLRLKDEVFFKDQISLTNLNGDMAWRKSNNEGLILISDGLTGLANGIKFTSDVIMRTPQGSDTRIALKTNFESGNTNDLQQLIPQNILPQDGEDWLKNAVLGGSIPNSEFIYEGSIKPEIGKNETDRLAVNIDLADATINFLNDWPATTGVYGTVRILDDSLKFSFSEGQVENFNLGAAQVQIDNLLSPEKRLRFTGDFWGFQSEFSNLIEKIPVKSTASNLLTEIEVDQILHVKIETGINLFGEFEQDLNGTVIFEGNTAKIRGTDLALRNLTGLLFFSEDKLNGKNLSATIGDKQFEVNVTSARNTVLTIDSVSSDGPMAKFVLSRQEQPDLIEIKIEKLHILDQTIKDTQVQIKRTDVNWVLKLSGDRISGRILVPLKKARASYDVNLNMLKITAFDFERQTNLTLLEVPPLNVEVDSLSYGNHALGRLAFKSYSENGAFHVKEFELLGDNLNLQMNGTWNSQPSNTLCTIKGSGKNLEEFFSSGDYSVKGLESSSTTFLLEAQWNDSPTKFNFSQVTGLLELSIQDGRILNLKPGTGRLFGLMSLQALPRRLSLDFKDLFQKGLSFDIIKGEFALKEGIATTDNMMLDGPSVTIEVSGKTDLKARSYKQVATVTPKLSDSIPVASALLGPVGLGAGAVYFLSQKVFKSIPGKVDEILQKEYLIEGDWENPTVTKIEQ